jgi:predicted metal-dependent hydrolase
MTMILPRPSPSAATAPSLDLPDGTRLPVHLRHSRRARRIALRVSAHQPGVELVVPEGVSVRQAMAFLETRRLWVAAQAAKLPPHIAFVDGALIPVLGLPRRLTALGLRRGVPPFRLSGAAIEVTGLPEHLARRTEAGLRNHARAILADKTAELAGTLGARPLGRVAVGDAATRWGSCSAAGNIKYSWRLVLAPESVLDYVVAHETAHLAEMNHSRQFWAVVERLYGPYDAQRQWLKRNGARLLRYG